MLRNFTELASDAQLNNVATSPRTKRWASRSAERDQFKHVKTVAFTPGPSACQNIWQKRGGQH
ncbi:MAG: hypothetical protein R3C16_02685 [Hyphomonadaceae bacterium]